MPEIRAYRAGDEAGIRRLFEICHDRPLELDVWSWRYAYRPEGVPVTMVAVDAGELVGHVSALPVQLERGSRTIKAGLWVDLMIEPKHRNLTLFLDLADANRRRCAETGVELLFAFPNGKSFPVLKRMLGWQDQGKSYDRIKLSLQRLANVTYNYDNAWWDGRQKKWTTKIFHIIDTVKINDSRSADHQGTSPTASSGNASMVSSL